jgi:predicted alpha/beta-hydrolase family hydrolase
MRASDLSERYVTVVAGRSYVSRSSATGFDADGLLLLAYPLHPPGRPEKIRDAHLRSITMPVLAFSGTRDPFVTRDPMERALTTLPLPGRCSGSKERITAFMC